MTLVAVEIPGIAVGLGSPDTVLREGDQLVGGSRKRGGREIDLRPDAGSPQRGVGSGRIDESVAVDVGSDGTPRSAADPVKADFSWASVAFGNALRSNASTPLACGAEKEVPVALT